MMDAKVLVSVYPCPKCHTSRRGPESKCICCGWTPQASREAHDVPSEETSVLTLTAFCLHAAIVTAATLFFPLATWIHVHAMWMALERPPQAPLAPVGLYYACVLAIPFNMTYITVLYVATNKTMVHCLVFLSLIISTILWVYPDADGALFLFWNSLRAVSTWILKG